MKYLNFFGVAALAILCGFQWQLNSRVSLEAQQLDKTRLEQAAKIDEQDRIIKSDTADLDDLRMRLSLSESALTEADRKVAVDEAELKQLKAALDKWMAAVAERDQALKQAGGVIQKLANERNDAILKFNDLAGKYNAVVKQLNDAGGGN
jgi:chromosome segregation ATPase